MNKFFASLYLIGMTAFHPATTQADQTDLDLFKKIDEMAGSETKPSATPTPDPSKGTQEPTVITAAQEASFDGKLRIANFLGEVHVKNPQFTLNSDKLTVYFRKQNDGTKPDQKSKQSEGANALKASPSSPIPASGAGGLERAVAEGNVVVVSDRPDANGGPPVHYVGKGMKVDYNAVTGEAILSIWPQVEQGINTIVATSESTVMHLFRDGKMKIEGPHKVNINDPGPDKTVESK